MKKLNQSQQYEAALMAQHDNPPAPFNPAYVHETKAEEEKRRKAMQAFSDRLPADMPEEQKRPLRAGFYQGYWEEFVAHKKEVNNG
jgi:hypothetical protein